MAMQFSPVTSYLFPAFMLPLFAIVPEVDILNFCWSYRVLVMQIGVLRSLWLFKGMLEIVT